MQRDRLWRIGDVVQMFLARVGVVVWFLCVAALFTILLCLASGCAFTLSDVNTGVTAGRTFEDGRVFDSSKTIWNVSVTGHWVRDKR